VGVLAQQFCVLLGQPVHHQRHQYCHLQRGAAQLIPACGEYGGGHDGAADPGRSPSAAGLVVATNAAVGATWERIGRASLSGGHPRTLRRVCAMTVRQRARRRHGISSLPRRQTSDLRGRSTRPMAAIEHVHTAITTTSARRWAKNTYAHRVRTELIAGAAFLPPSYALAARSPLGGPGGRTRLLRRTARCQAPLRFDDVRVAVVGAAALPGLGMVRGGLGKDVRGQPHLEVLAVGRKPVLPDRDGKLRLGSLLRDRW